MLAAIGAASCGNSATAKATPKPSPTPTPAIDSCLLGRWVLASIGGADWYITWNDGKGNVVGHEHVPLGGGAGGTFTVAPDGTERADWTGSAPFYGQTQDGYRLAVRYYGYATARLHTAPGARFSDSDGDHSHETTSTQLGTETPPPAVPSSPEPAQAGDITGTYACTTHRLQLSYDNGQVQTFTR
jgi:hypothetical protein